MKLQEIAKVTITILTDNSTDSVDQMASILAKPVELRTYSEVRN